jgi:hypothetical protein
MFSLPMVNTKVIFTAEKAGFSEREIPFTE